MTGKRGVVGRGEEVRERASRQGPGPGVALSMSFIVGSTLSRWLVARELPELLCLSLSLSLSLSVSLSLATFRRPTSVGFPLSLPLPLTLGEQCKQFNLLSWRNIRHQ